MLVISFKLIGVFLGLYLSGVSATPTGVPRNTTALVPRATPENNMCVNTDPWVTRECIPEFGHTAWKDACWSQHSRPPFEYKRFGRCPINTYCQNIEEDDDHTIKCVDQQAPGTSAPPKSPIDPQIGSSINFRVPAGLGGSPFGFSVKILNSIKASVAAFVISKFS
jgi:hypothetical protein